MYGAIDSLIFSRLSFVFEHVSFSSLCMQGLCFHTVSYEHLMHQWFMCKIEMHQQMNSRKKTATDLLEKRAESVYFNSNSTKLQMTFWIFQTTKHSLNKLHDDLNCRLDFINFSSAQCVCTMHREFGWIVCLNQSLHEIWKFIWSICKKQLCIIKSSRTRKDWPKISNVKCVKCKMQIAKCSERESERKREKEKTLAKPLHVLAQHSCFLFSGASRLYAHCTVHTGTLF